MSYPVPRYRGDSGLINATFRPSDQSAELIYPSGGQVRYLATGQSTGGQFGLYRWEMTAAPSGPEPHFHKTISESFYILTGAVRLFDGSRWREAAPGDFLFVPEGGIHGFRNELTDELASMLLLFAPGAPREGYFETLKRMGEGLTMTDDERAAFYTAHDNVWL